MQINQSKSKKRRVTPSDKQQLSTSQERCLIPKYMTLNNQNINKSNKYQILEQIGQGSYSTIFIVEDKLHGGYYAMKKVLQDPKQINRELEIHTNMRHPHIAPLRDHYHTYENKTKYLHLVMDLYQGNLKNAIRVPIKRVAKQLFQALEYLESQNIMHRDLKPANILYQSGNIYLADFGSAKKMDGSKSLSYVCSRAYRAPELLFGQIFYNTKIDIWAAGCILAELELGKQLFFGQNTVDQIVEICKFLGTPNELEKAELGCQFYIPNLQAKKLSMIFIYIVLNQKTDPLLIDLLSKIFVFSPSKRINCSEALRHPYFLS
ncbi:unnamed protein product (macronuclear) [Paramecium tetraurelia]|uniref:Protein kinase domain-containing protein n=1 Tax=Paramecium tetraurelia TaxID=5888 RepID=A0EBT6_PARTE|nr:uncharacterized protein GSPATT00025488001 [Paramecium tetraurelia]CAK92753.1 unnamed protein product [Paramecium tetraurelia]|eukprot:XP_001460150.1 hypothetical protein (macronuclear) [Paramecium tetraurelia strain d4-2]